MAKGWPSWRATPATPRLRHHLLLDFLRHSVKSFIDTLGRFRTRLEEGHAKLRSELFALFVRDLASILHIALVSDQNLAHAGL